MKNRINGKHIYFYHDSENDKPKTEVWDILTKSDNYCLGEIKWYAQWRQYCFFPEKDLVFSASCIKEISSFILKLMNKRKKSLSEGD